MKIDRLEAHDRLQYLKNDQSISIFKGADDCLKKNRLSVGMQSKSPYIYIFAHPRTADDGVNKVMYWQPRLTKPKAQTNSYLFRATSHTDLMEICWLIPPRDTWMQYQRGNVTESETVLWSIREFCNNRKILETPLPEDLSDERCKQIYIAVAMEMDEEMRMKKIYENKNDSSKAL